MAFNIPIPPVYDTGWGNLIKQAFQGYEDSLFGMPMKEEALQKSILENKYLPQEKETDLAYKKAQAEKQNAIMNLISQYLGGGSGGIPGEKGAPPQMPNMMQNRGHQAPLGGNGSETRSQAISDQLGQGDQPQQQPSAMPQQGAPISNRDLAKESFISHLLGFGANQVVDINGSKYALTGTGKLFPVAKGLSPSEEAFQKEMGKNRGEAYTESSKVVTGLQNQSLALDDMINAVSTDPEFFNVSGPVKSYFTKWVGNPQQQDLLGRLQTSSGEIALQVAPSLKGAFTGRDQTLINTIKANPNTDFPYVFMGKLKSQKLINSVLEERESLAAQYIRQGDDPLTAHKKAAKQTSLEKYRPIVDKLLDPMVTIRNQKGEEKQVPLSEAIKLKAKGAK